MVRKLKHHEQKLLKKTNLVSWKSDNPREVKVMRKYHLQKREDYHKYTMLANDAKNLATKLRGLPPADSFRLQMTDQLLEKLYSMGLISTRKNLELCEKVSSSAFCRRRLPVVMVTLRMAQRVADAVKFVEQGHVRVGVNVVMDPAFLVTRNMEDFVTWTDTSKIKRKVKEYNDELDDFEMM
eukprot:scpid58243/ scgid32930/ U3 small nucleolar ribonucleoprotein protein IMP3